MSFPAIVFQSWLVINSFHFYAIISFYAFVFTSAENMLLLPGLHVWWSAQQQSLMKILSLRKREVLKQLKKITSATVLASVHSTGAPAVGSINDWILAKANTPALIFTTAQLQNGSCNSTVIHSVLAAQWFIIITVFCDTVTFVLLSFTDVLYSIGKTSNETEAPWLFRWNKIKVGDGSKIKNCLKNSNYDWLFSYLMEAKITVELWESEIWVGPFCDR